MAFGSVKHNKQKVSRAASGYRTRARIFNVKVIVQRVNLQRHHQPAGFVAAACIGGKTPGQNVLFTFHHGAHNLPGYCTLPQRAGSPTKAAEKALRALGKKGALSRMSHRKRG